MNFDVGHYQFPNTLPSPLSPSKLFLGNDIVCRSSLSPRAKGLDPRYLTKIFNRGEKKYIRNASDPVKMLAIFWALKEAAYKIYIQQSGKRYFAPKDFVIQKHLPNLHFQIQTPKGRQWGQIEVNRDYVHAICRSSKSTYLNKQQMKVVFLGEIPKEHLSQAIKSLLLEEIANFLDLPSQGLHLSFAPNGVPMIFQNGKRLSMRTSISHDGPWGAFVFSKLKAYKIP